MVHLANILSEKAQNGGRLKLMEWITCIKLTFYSTISYITSILHIGMYLIASFDIKWFITGRINYNIRILNQKCFFGICYYSYVIDLILQKMVDVILNFVGFVNPFVTYIGI